jgi:hypothetical protein
MPPRGRNREMVEKSPGGVKESGEKEARVLQGIQLAGMARSVRGRSAVDWQAIRINIRKVGRGLHRSERKGFS